MSDSLKIALEKATIAEEDAERFRFICKLCTESPITFRKVMSQALTLAEYRASIDEERAK